MGLHGLEQGYLYFFFFTLPFIIRVCLCVLVIKSVRNALSGIRVGVFTALLSQFAVYYRRDSILWGTAAQQYPSLGDNIMNMNWKSQ
jgi:hypothetical protein